ncbi:unnamed protein product [Allacma fusca]|uniref:Uncharacterized protein n=1 Tax=Allacma fusca TaxID=39272 RepID=A0A8J2NTI5_9HEXA|nr:unnamed protein product [Allacma fusca]
MKRAKYQAVNNISQRKFRRRVGKEIEILNYKLNQEPPRAELAFPLHINQTIPPGEYVHFGVEKAIQKALGKLENIRNEPFVIGLWCGDGKPANVNEF